jgi:hypothetical protein
LLRRSARELHRRIVSIAERGRKGRRTQRTSTNFLNACSMSPFKSSYSSIPTLRRTVGGRQRQLVWNERRQRKRRRLTKTGIRLRIGDQAPLNKRLDTTERRRMDEVVEKIREFLRLLLRLRIDGKTSRSSRHLLPFAQQRRRISLQRRMSDLVENAGESFGCGRSGERVKP